jgi:hypothetical protein
MKKSKKQKAENFDISKFQSSFKTWKEQTDAGLAVEEKMKKDFLIKMENIQGLIGILTEMKSTYTKEYL